MIIDTDPGTDDAMAIILALNSPEFKVEACILTGTNKNAMLIPQAAVIEIQSMYQVVVLSPENTAQFRAVKVGQRVGTDWIIEQGLNPGEKVIVQGFMKVRQGTPVSPKPYVVAAAAGGN